MPNIPENQQFKDEVQHPGYPCVERGGIIWTYMGLTKDLPELPDFEFLRVPDEHRIYRVRGTSTIVPENLDWVEGVRDAMTVPTVK
jgi:phenylpropionate dioxygenase-like ring-hydroxylating dioxygenase large terminal subunit